MLNWLVHIILAVAGVIAAWFVSPGAENFDVVEMAMTLILVIFFVAIAAFWPALVDLRRFVADVA